MCEEERGKGGSGRNVRDVLVCVLLCMRPSVWKGEKE